MADRLRALLLRLLKVPPEPEPPAGAPESLRVFRAGRNFYRLLLVRWAFAQLAGIAVISYLLFSGILDFKIVWLSRLLTALEWFGLVSLIVQMPFTLFLVKLDFEMRWYVVTDRSLRIRYGLQRVRELTMTFANIQEISVRQGPLQRLLGIADVEVKTAGGGSGVHGHDASGDDAGHIAHFHGVENASEVRDLILERLRKLRDAGLGDPDDVPDEPAPPSSMHPLCEAAAAILHEARELRKSLATTPASR